MQECDPTLDILDRLLKCPVLASRFCLNTANGSFSDPQIGLRYVDCPSLDGHRDLVGFPVELNEEIPFLYVVIVIDQNLRHLTGHPGRHERHVTVHVRIISRNGVESLPDPRNTEHKDDCEQQKQRLPPAASTAFVSADGLLEHSVGRHVTPCFVSIARRYVGCVRRARGN